MVKAFTLLVALLIGLSFSGMTFAKSLGASSDQLTIQAPQGDGTKDDTKDDEKKDDAPKMEGDKDKEGEGEDGKDKK